MGSSTMATTSGSCVGPAVDAVIVGWERDAAAVEASDNNNNNNSGVRSARVLPSGAAARSGAPSTPLARRQQQQQQQQQRPVLGLRGAVMMEKTGPRRAMMAGSDGCSGGSIRSTPMRGCGVARESAGLRQTPRTPTTVGNNNSAQKNTNRGKAGGGSSSSTPIKRKQVKPSTRRFFRSATATIPTCNGRSGPHAATVAEATGGRERQQQNFYRRAHSFTFARMTSTFHTTTAADAPAERRQQQLHRMTKQQQQQQQQPRQKDEKLFHRSSSSPAKKVAAGAALSPASKKATLLAMQGTKKTRRESDGTRSLLRPPSLTPKPRPSEAVAAASGSASTMQPRWYARLNTPTHHGSLTQTRQRSAAVPQPARSTATTTRATSVRAPAPVTATTKKVLRTASAPCFPKSRTGTCRTRTCEPKNGRDTSQSVEVKGHRRQPSLTPASLQPPNTRKPTPLTRTASDAVGQPARKTPTPKSMATSTAAAPRRTGSCTTRACASPSAAAVSAATGRGTRTGSLCTPSSAGKLKGQNTKATAEECRSAEARCGVSQKKPLLGARSVVIRPTNSTIMREAATRQKEHQRIKREHETLAAEVEHLSHATWIAMRRELKRLVSVRAKRMEMMHAVDAETVAPFHTVNDCYDSNSHYVGGGSDTKNNNTAGGSNIALLREDDDDEAVQRDAKLGESPQRQVDTTAATSAAIQDARQGTTWCCADTSDPVKGEVAEPQRAEGLGSGGNYRRSGTSETYCGRLHLGKRFSSPYRGPCHRGVGENEQKLRVLPARCCNGAVSSPVPRALSASASAAPAAPPPAAAAAAAATGSVLALNETQEWEKGDWTYSFTLLAHRDTVDEGEKENRVEKRMEKSIKSSRSPSIRPPSPPFGHFNTSEEAESGGGEAVLASICTHTTSSEVDFIKSPIVQLLATPSSGLPSTVFYESPRLTRKTKSPAVGVRGGKRNTKAPALNFCRTHSLRRMPHSGTPLRGKQQQQRRSNSSMVVGARGGGAFPAPHDGCRGDGNTVVLSSDMLVALYATMHGTADQNANRNIVAFERLRSGRSSRNSSLMGRRGGRRKMQQRLAPTRALSFSDALATHANISATGTISKMQTSKTGSSSGVGRGVARISTTTTTTKTVVV